MCLYSNFSHTFSQLLFLFLNSLFYDPYFFLIAIGQALNLASSITKFPLAGILTDRAILYKHAFAKIPLKNTVVDEDSMLYREQVAAVCTSFVINYFL